MKNLYSNTHKKLTFKDFHWVLPFGCFIIGYLMLAYIFQPEIVKTPNLVGKNIHQATLVSSDYNLNLRVLAQKEDVDLPTGTILSQTPAAGQKIKPHQSLFLVLSNKPAAALVPHLQNKTLKDSLSALETLLISKKIFEIESVYPRGQCIAQNPTEGWALNERQAMILYVSAGNKKPVLWPNFNKKNINDVIDFLASHDIHPEVIHSYPTSESHDCQNCYVYEQRPLPGSVIILDKQHPLRVQILAQKQK